jgi:2-phosphosulfolactate phosphatase
VIYMFDQSPFLSRVEWGVRGAREAASRGDITIIVDVLSFSSTVVTAASYGAIIFPHPKNETVQAFAEKVQAKLIIGRAEAAVIGKPTLSPVSFEPLHAGLNYVLSSINGAVCSWTASQAHTLLIGCLLNAHSVAAVANQLQLETGSIISVIPCGEQWIDFNEGENQLRPAIEDYLGAGAILSQLKGTPSPEAEVCIQAFRNSEHRLVQLIWDCGSGRELRELGFEADVIHCSLLNAFETVPILNGDHFVKYG